ncbi:MAG: DUF4143 domain-containing protein [Endomicrobium sp.]|jgi:hypothetical protein|nr:DUF4143 domain-containing protein [Endomicrobium sp.]
MFHVIINSKVKVRQSSPRFMVFDTSLMTYSDGASRKRLLENSEAKGHLVESAVGAYLLAKGKEEDFDVFWWRDRGSEIDFVSIDYFIVFIFNRQTFIVKFRSLITFAYIISVAFFG